MLPVVTPIVLRNHFSKAVRERRSTKAGIVLPRPVSGMSPGSKAMEAML